MDDDDDDGYDVGHPLWNPDNRKRTFTDWRNPHVTVDSLVGAGFMYVGPGDKTKCVFCYFTVNQWNAGEDPFRRHVEGKPECPFIESLVEEKQKDVPESEENVIRQHPAQPIYSHLEARLKTFETWPRGHPMQPDQLANAGFFFTQQGDRVQCFYCNLFVERWEPNDDVFVEHCRFNPKCPYMQLQKGREFIQQCIPGATATEPSIDPSDASPTIEVMKETLLSQGYSRIFIDVAFLQQKLNHARTFRNSEDLLHTIMQLPRAEEAASKRMLEPTRTSQAEIDLMKTCKICLRRPWEFICLPCKHFTCCSTCKDNINKCPICDQLLNYASIDEDVLSEKLTDVTL